MGTVSHKTWEIRNMVDEIIKEFKTGLGEITNRYFHNSPEKSRAMTIAVVSDIVNLIDGIEDRYQKETTK